MIIDIIVGLIYGPLLSIVIALIICIPGIIVKKLRNYKAIMYLIPVFSLIICLLGINVWNSSTCDPSVGEGLSCLGRIGDAVVSMVCLLIGVPNFIYTTGFCILHARGFNIEKIKFIYTLIIYAILVVIAWCIFSIIP